MDYKIKTKRGLWFSFEREMYDMIRSAFLKYACQIRIGRMDGAFVAYHNTREIFGFQYVPLTFMDKTVFGSTHMANTFFGLASSVLGRVLDEVLADHGTARKLRLTVSPTNRRCLKVAVEEIIDETRLLPADGREDAKLYHEVAHERHEWYLWVKTELNGGAVDKPWHFTEDHSLQVSYCLQDLGSRSTKEDP